MRIIERIPIQEGAVDNIAWHFDSKGNFSVKSAYQVVLNLQDKGIEIGSTSIANEKGYVNGKENFNCIQWKKLWSLPLQGKQKHFMWRIANNSLPLRMKLKRKGIELDTRCPVCYRFDEDGGHYFLNAKELKHYGEKLKWRKIVWI